MRLRAKSAIIASTIFVRKGSAPSHSPLSLSLALRENALGTDKLQMTTFCQGSGVRFSFSLSASQPYSYTYTNTRMTHTDTRLAEGRE